MGSDALTPGSDFAVVTGVVSPPPSVDDTASEATHTTQVSDELALSALVVEDVEEEDKAGEVAGRPGPDAASAVRTPSFSHL